MTIMWALNNQTPYAAERNWIRDKQGVHHWLVAVKATFDIGDRGALTLTDEQTPPVLAPEYFGAPGESGLRLDSDLLAVKPCTDVILDAAAHVPRGNRATSVQVSLRIADVAKTLLVHGDRVYYKGVGSGLTTSTPQPFSTRPIRYERAFGGGDATSRDPRNPIGVGFALEPDRLIHKPAPTVTYPSGDPSKLGPAGFGPIDSAWSPRRERAGTFDAKWERSKKPLLPDDYDELFASGAPRDQRPSQILRGGERVELEQLTPEGMLRFELPKIFLAFTTHFGARHEEHRARLITVVIAPDQRRVALVWQTNLAVTPRDDDYLDQTVIREKPYV